MALKYNLKNINATTHIYFNPENSNSLESVDFLDDVKTIIESNDDFIVPNESDINDTYNNLSGYICRLIENSNFLCKGLNLSYIKNSFEEANAIIAISSGDNINILPNGNIFGFALLQFNEDNSLYIDVICSHVGIKYAGDILLKSINHMCNILFITKIKLNSVDSAISFYEKYGFYKKGICDNNEELCEMEKILTKKSLGGKPRKSKKRNVNKRGKTKKNKTNKRNKTKTNKRNKTKKN